MSTVLAMPAPRPPVRRLRPLEVVADLRAGAPWGWSQLRTNRRVRRAVAVRVAATAAVLALYAAAGSSPATITLVAATATLVGLVSAAARLRGPGALRRRVHAARLVETVQVSAVGPATDGWVQVRLTGMDQQIELLDADCRPLGRTTDPDDLSARSVRVPAEFAELFQDVMARGESGTYDNYLPLGRPEDHVLSVTFPSVRLTEADDRPFEP